VINAARDHESAVERSLLSGVPVLVEKPMALTAAAAGRLTELATRRNTRLAAAHVFLFARYLDRFSALAKAAGHVRFLRVEWTDPRLEHRYGEPKRYDPGLPLLADLLPHVFSLVRALAPTGPDRCDHLVISGDGAEADVALTFGDLPCNVHLARESDYRRRVLEAGIGDRVLRLDFSQEPGLISCGAVSTVGDADWMKQSRPLARMLTAFLQWAAGGDTDDRLDADLGLRACRMIDETLARSKGCPV
jgi:predicted dehydrogenase